MIKFILLLAILAIQCRADISISIGTRYRYNDQFNGSNGWPSNGRSIDDDSARSTRCLNGITYTIMNDGLGPNNSLASGRNLFITSLSSGFTGPSSGQLYTLVNGMDSYGTITQINSGDWTDGKHWKSDGSHCEGGRLFISQYRQGLPHFGTGSFNWSDDYGVTWCSYAHTNHVTGACTVAASATGDAPTNGQQQFDYTGMRGFAFLQYGADNVSSSVVEGNDVWSYQYLQGDTINDIYVTRITHANFRLMDETLRQFYRGSGLCTADASWSTNQADKVRMVGGTNIISNVMYIPETGYYILEGIEANQDAVFYSSRSACGPFLEAARIVYGGDPTVLQAWFSPVIQSISTVPSGSSYVTTVLLISGWSAGGRTGSAATNNYSQFDNFVTITSSAPRSVATSGKTTWGGKVAIQ